MPTFDKPGFQELGVCDKDGRAFTFKLPHTTTDKREIWALKSGGAVETAPPKPSPKKYKDGDDE